MHYVQEACGIPMLRSSQSQWHGTHCCLRRAMRHAMRICQQEQLLGSQLHACSEQHMCICLAIDLAMSRWMKS